jgi:hypothetical protein
LIFRTQADRKIWAQPDAFESFVEVLYSLSSIIAYLFCVSWDKGYATGDENIAIENLRRFFEQHFHEFNDSYGHRSFFLLKKIDYTSFRGIRQHALLHLIRMHYVRGEYAAAHKVFILLS